MFNKIFTQVRDAGSATVQAFQNDRLRKQVMYYGTAIVSTAMFGVLAADSLRLRNLFLTQCTQLPRIVAQTHLAKHIINALPCLDSRVVTAAGLAVGFGITAYKCVQCARHLPRSPTPPTTQKKTK